MIAMKDSNNSKGIYLSIVNIHKEKSLGHESKVKSNGLSTLEKSPPIYINVFVMVTAFFDQYDTSVIHLNSALEFFQNKPYLDRYNLISSLTWPDGIEKMTFDWYNLEIDKLNQLWGINGGGYKPSSLFQISMLKVEHTTPAIVGPAIEELNMETQYS